MTLQFAAYRCPDHLHKCHVFDQEIVCPECGPVEGWITDYQADETDPRFLPGTIVRVAPLVPELGTHQAKVVEFILPIDLPEDLLID